MCIKLLLDHTLTTTSLMFFYSVQKISLLCYLPFNSKKYDDYDYPCLKLQCRIRILIPGLEHLQEKEENENKYLSVIEANKNILVENEQNFNGTSDTPSQMEQITEEPIFDQNFKQIHTQEYPSLSKSTSVITSAQSQTFVDVQSRNSIIVKNETPSNNTEQQFQQVNNDLSTFER